MMDDTHGRQWVPVKQTTGLYRADLLSAELRQAGIPARVVRESAGAALGLSTGKLGEMRIEVPAERVEEASHFLAQFREPAGESAVADAGTEWEAAYDPDDGVPLPDEYSDDGPDWFSRLSRGALVVAAVAFSPIGVVLAVIGSWLSGRRDPD
jgi:hypothetical protein